MEVLVRAAIIRPRSPPTAGMPDDAPSKTQRKQEMHALQALGQRLVALNAAQLASVELPERLRGAIAEAQRVRSRVGGAAGAAPRSDRRGAADPQPRGAPSPAAVHRAAHAGGRPGADPRAAG